MNNRYIWNSKNGEMSGKTFSLNSDIDLIEVRDYGRSLAAHMGFREKEQTLIATALSEICRNVLEYAGNGKVVIETNRRKKPSSIEITISDEGPGIKNIDLSLQDGYSTGQGLGVGMPGAKRIMDEFAVESEIGKGTTVKMKKRLNDYGF